MKRIQQRMLNNVSLPSFRHPHPSSCAQQQKLAATISSAIPLSDTGGYPLGPPVCEQDMGSRRAAVLEVVPGDRVVFADMQEAVQGGQVDEEVSPSEVKSHVFFIDDGSVGTVMAVTEVEGLHGTGMLGWTDRLGDIFVFAKEPGGVS